MSDMLTPAPLRVGCQSNSPLSIPNVNLPTTNTVVLPLTHAFQHYQNVYSAALRESWGPVHANRRRGCSGDVGVLSQGNTIGPVVMVRATERSRNARQDCI